LDPLHFVESEERALALDPADQRFGRLFERIRIADQFPASLNRLALSWRRFGFSEQGNTGPPILLHSLRGQLITQTGPLSRPALTAPFAAASQLEPIFNFDGPSASKDRYERQHDRG
jgi:hypothetical protein